MRLLALLCVLFCSGSSFAAVINVEYQFTPFIGDPAKSNEVESVPGKAVVFLNNVPVAEQEVSKRSMPVLFEAREIAAAVWMPIKSFGTLVKKGKNVIRIEFAPTNTKLAYQSRLQWAQVTDQVSEQSAPGAYSATNQAGQGMETLKQQGKAVLEKEFMGDFADGAAWHANPAITELSTEDKQQLTALVTQRAGAFSPKFERTYKFLETQVGIQITELRKMQCLDKAYAAGVRVVPPKPTDIEMTLTASPVVVVTGKEGELYPFDKKAFARIKGEDIQMCAGSVLYMAYPPRLLFVRNAVGTWETIDQ